MLEYFSTLKTTIDIVNGLFAAKTHLKSEVAVFDDVITPMHSNLSKVTTDYLTMLSELRLSLTGEFSETHVKSVATDFWRRRLVYLTLRRELAGYCVQAEEQQKLKIFHNFFCRVRMLLSPEPDSPSALIAHVSFEMLKDDVQPSKFKELISIIKDLEKRIEQQWIATTKEYGRLSIKYKTHRLK